MMRRLKKHSEKKKKGKTEIENPNVIMKLAVNTCWSLSVFVQYFPIIGQKAKNHSQ